MEDRDIFNRIFDKLDTYDERLNNTCNTMTEIKTTLGNFIEAVEKREQESRNNIERKYKNITVVFGSITSVSILVGLSKVFGLF